MISYLQTIKKKHDQTNTVYLIIVDKPLNQSDGRSRQHTSWTPPRTPSWLQRHHYHRSWRTEGRSLQGTQTRSDICIFALILRLQSALLFLCFLGQQRRMFSNRLRWAHLDRLFPVCSLGRYWTSPLVGYIQHHRTAWSSALNSAAPPAGKLPKIYFWDRSWYKTPTKTWKRTFLYHHVFCTFQQR